MKRQYRSPSLAVYGSLSEITLGILGNSPDVPPFTNVNCLTGSTTGPGGGTFILTCASIIRLS